MRKKSVRFSGEAGAPALPPGWASALDSASGLEYYYCVTTGESQWSPPRVKPKRGEVHAATPPATTPDGQRSSRRDGGEADDRPASQQRPRRQRLGEQQKRQQQSVKKHQKKALDLFLKRQHRAQARRARSNDPLDFIPQARVPFPFASPSQQQQGQPAPSQASPPGSPSAPPSRHAVVPHAAHPAAAARLRPSKRRLSPLGPPFACASGTDHLLVRALPPPPPARGERPAGSEARSESGQASWAGQPLHHARQVHAQGW